MQWKTTVLLQLLIAGVAALVPQQLNPCRTFSSAPLLPTSKSDQAVTGETYSKEEGQLSRRGLLKHAFLSVFASAVILNGRPASAAVQVVEETKVQPVAVDLGRSTVQFETVDDVPKDYFTENKKIYAFVERIIDGDTFRVRHYPNYSPFSSPTPEPLKQRGIANSTLKIRLYGIDTPELAKNKNQVSQPFGQEAKDFTTNMIYHKMVEVTFFKKDQYSRAICMVKTVPTGTTESKDVAVELARAGLAEIYTGSGAVYGGSKELLEKAVVQAQQLKSGIWSQGDNLVLAKDAKLCVRNGGEVNTCYREGSATVSVR